MTEEDDKLAPYVYIIFKDDKPEAAFSDYASAEATLTAWQNIDASQEHTWSLTALPVF